MSVLLLNSFSFFAANPPMSTSYLCGYLKENEIYASQLDVNLELWDTFLSPEYLAQREYRPENVEKSKCPLCNPTTPVKFRDLKKYVVRNIRKALEVLKDKKDFYDFSKFNWAMSVIYQAQALIYYDYGTFLTSHLPFWPGIGFEVQDLKKVYELSEDRNLNPFIDVMEKVIIPKIDEKNPDIILVDIIFPWDILPALTLNKLIKKHYSKIHINYPGQGFDEFTFSRLKERFKTQKELMFGFDSIFVYRNDNGVCQLIKKLNDGNLAEISNLAFLNGNGEVEMGQEFVKGCYMGEVEYDYSDLRLDRYFTPELVFVEKLSDRCFWAKCNFCSINIHKGERREFNADRIVSKLKSYKQKYGCSTFWFLDEACTADFALKFSQKLLAEKVDVIWSIRTRIDDSFTRDVLEKLHKRGLRELWIGLESVSPEILKLMNKTDQPGQYEAIAARMLKDCSDIGIGIHFCIIFGFPSETDEQRQKMADFFNRNRASLEKMPLFSTFNTFGLMHNSPMYLEPEQFGITYIDKSGEYFSMESIPYKTRWGDETTKQENKDKIEQCFNKLGEIIVRDQMNMFTWFNVCDSPYELLFKKFYSESGQGNPFQKKVGTMERLLTKAYMGMSEIPYISTPFKEFSQKHFMGIK